MCAAPRSFSIPESHDQGTLDIAPLCQLQDSPSLRHSFPRLWWFFPALNSSFRTCLGALVCRSVEAFLKERSRRGVWRGTGLK